VSLHGISRIGSLTTSGQRGLMTNPRQEPRPLFDQLLADGIDPDQLIEAASNIEQKQLMPMSSWLGSLLKRYRENKSALNEPY
jgi:hypothetical protein